MLLTFATLFFFCLINTFAFILSRLRSNLLFWSFATAELLPYFRYTKGHFVTEAGTVGMYFVKMPRFLHLLGEIL